MRALSFALLLGCGSSSGGDGGADAAPDGTQDGAGEDATPDGGGEAAPDSGPMTCDVPDGGAMCGGLVWECDERDDCGPGRVCCLELDMMNVKGSICTGFCSNPRLQLCKSMAECSGGMLCLASSCSGWNVRTCGGIPPMTCK